MSKYKVTSRSEDLWNERESVDENDIRADDIRQEYGLTFLAVAQVRKKWEHYSDMMCAGWMMPNKESVEDVFNVTLEIRNEEEYE